LIHKALSRTVDYIIFCTCVCLHTIQSCNHRTMIGSWLHQTTHVLRSRTFIRSSGSRSLTHHINMFLRRRKIIKIVYLLTQKCVGVVYLKIQIALCLLFNIVFEHYAQELRVLQMLLPAMCVYNRHSPRSGMNRLAVSDSSAH